jgi:F-type H+-transporting ATPase subunit a
MMLAPLLLALALVQAAHEPAPAPPAHQEATTAGAEGHAAPAEAANAEGHAAAEGHEAGAAEHGPSEILMHHVTDQPYAPFGISLGRSKHLVFFIAAAALVILLAQLARLQYKEGHLPTGLAAAVETVVLFVRDEIAEKNIGHDGRRFTPLLLSFFFFILVAALLGLVPGTATSTGNIAVTLALATVSFFAGQWAGISKYGFVHHFVGLVPPGMPAWLLPIMIPVEILGLFSKPFALMIRLFANMLAGHMVITALLLLIPLMARITPAAGIAMAPVSIALSLFIMILEVLVAFIQAYIFTLLTSIFIGMYAHPAH